MDNLINALANARINETITGEVEQWKAIDGYDVDYWISSLGRVYSKKRKIILKQSPNTNGYSTVALNKDKKSKTCMVHRLVASAFIPNPDNLPVVDHCNRCKTDNRASNLRWTTQKENCRNREVNCSIRLRKK